MGCISDILKLKGDKEFLVIPEDHHVAIEDGGIYRGYEFLITFNIYGFRCGYVSIEPNHPAFNKDLEDKDNDYLKVHGGIKNFFKHKDYGCKDKWIVFSCTQYGDIFDYSTTMKYFPYTEKIFKSLEDKLEKDFPNHKEIMNKFGSIKSKEFVIQECKRLIDQLIEKEK